MFDKSDYIIKKKKNFWGTQLKLFQKKCVYFDKGLTQNSIKKLVEKTEMK